MFSLKIKIRKQIYQSLHMKCFSRLGFISHSNIFNSISAVTGMHEFLTLQLPRVEVMDSFIGVKLLLIKMFVPSLRYVFSLFNLASFFIYYCNFSCWQKEQFIFRFGSNIGFAKSMTSLYAIFFNIYIYVRNHENNSVL